MGSHTDYIEVDVVIIGAGLAGLTAAKCIVDAGYSCRVLEARDRVGGRTWSQKQPSGGMIDVGAAWINDTNQSCMIELARRFNLELIVQNTAGDVILQHNDSLKRFPYGDTPDVSEYMIGNVLTWIMQSFLTVSTIPVPSRNQGESRAH